MYWSLEVFWTRPRVRPQIGKYQKMQWRAQTLHVAIHLINGLLNISNENMEITLPCIAEDFFDINGGREYQASTEETPCRGYDRPQSIVDGNRITEETKWTEVSNDMKRTRRWSDLNCYFVDDKRVSVPYHRMNGSFLRSPWTSGHPSQPCTETLCTRGSMQESANSRNGCRHAVATRHTVPSEGEERSWDSDKHRAEGDLRGERARTGAGPRCLDDGPRPQNRHARDVHTSAKHFVLRSTA